MSDSSMRVVGTTHSITPYTDDIPTVLDEDAQIEYLDKAIQVIRQRNNSVLVDFSNAIAQLETALEQRRHAEIDLIRAHIDSGEQMVRLSQWFKRYFPQVKAKVWEEWVFAQLSYPYTRRTAQRDRRTYLALAQYRDRLFELEGKSLTITVRGLYELGRSGREAVEYALDLFEKFVDSDKAGQLETIRRISEKQVEQIIEVANVIESAPEPVREDVKRVALDARVVDVNTAKLLVEKAEKDPVFFEEIKATGHANLPIGDNGEPVPVPIDQLAVVGVKMIEREAEIARALREQAHVVESVQRQNQERRLRSQLRKGCTTFEQETLLSKDATLEEFERAVERVTIKMRELWESNIDQKLTIHSDRYVETPDADDPVYTEDEQEDEG